MTKIAKFISRASSVLAGLFVIGGFAPASGALADTIATVTYTGTATSVYDPTGLFGSASPNLFSADFVDVFKIDLNDGFLNHYNFGDIPEEQLLGGAIFGPPTPVMSSKITINGKSVEFLGDTIGQEDNRQGVFVNSVAESGVIGGQSGLSSYNYVTIETSAPLSLSESYSGVSVLPNNFASYFTICNFTAVSANASVCFSNNETLNGFLNPETVNITISGSVPEPKSWVLMVIGFGAVGGMIRARRRGPAVASAA